LCKKQCRFCKDLLALNFEIWRTCAGHAPLPQAKIDAIALRLAD
jgi:hypothetical protein